MFKKISLNSLVIFLLIGCGGGGGSSSPATNETNSNPTNSTPTITNETNSNPTQTIEGKIIDGYIKNATVFIDTNNNSILDNSELQTFSDENGNYKFSATLSNLPSHFNIVSYGGIDTTTLKVFESVLKKVVQKDNISKEEHLTPVTTLTSQVVGTNLTKEALVEAKSKVASFLEMDVKIVDKDPIATFNEDSSLYLKSLKIIESVKFVNELASYTTKSENLIKSFDVLVKNISNNEKFKDISTLTIENTSYNVSEQFSIINKTIEKITTIEQSSTNLNTTDALISSINFNKAYNHIGTEVKKSFGDYTVEVYTNQPLSSLTIPANTTKAVYGTINGLPTNSLLKINETYPDKTMVIVKVYKDSKLVGVSVIKELLSSDISLNFGVITTTL